MMTIMGNIKPEDYEVIDSDFSMMLKQVYPFVIEANFTGEWVPVKYAVSESAAEKFISGYQKSNNVNFTVHHNDDYIPRAVDLAIEEMTAFVKMLKCNK